MADRQGKDLWSVLASVRELAASETEKGAVFEQMTRAYLRADPVWRERFAEVWRFSEWPERPASWTDVGIDLVAEERSGGYCAIQCKFYEPRTSIDAPDIATFLASSHKTKPVRFSSLLLVATTDHFTSKARQLLESHDPPITRLSVSQMALADVDWSGYDLSDPTRLQRFEQKELRPHQKRAIADIKAGFSHSDRGKLVMACGTGKTFVALKLAEDVVPAGGTALFLVPSISLLQQSLQEWVGEARRPLSCFAVCSDSDVTKDSEDIHTYDLALPATTRADVLVSHLQVSSKRIGSAENPLNVVFSTYQSLPRVIDAQNKGFPEFDLVVADEAHRSAGATQSGTDATSFVLVHDAAKLRAKKRLYMTATPKIYSEGAKRRAQELDVEVASMDDETVFGPELHRLGFGDAVEAGLLSDYRVVILTVDQDTAAAVAHPVIADRTNDLALDDAAKLVGCWRGLSKIFEQEEDVALDYHDVAPARRAVMFANTIKSSELMTDTFAQVAKAAQGSLGDGVEIAARHVDGTMGATERAGALAWLRAEPAASECRVLSNARCLTEGIDVPALDAIMFLQPRKSQIDVVQALGRIMRKAEGKRYGYVILPVVVPSDKTPEEVLDQTDAYDVVWQVLQALRAHDERFDAFVNKLDLTVKKDPRLIIGSVGPKAGSDHEGAVSKKVSQLAFEGLSGAVLAKIVKKVGSRRYWEQWAADIAKLADSHIARINASLQVPKSPIREPFDRFVSSLHESINDSISEVDAIEMLAQHLITRPVFEALFGSEDFVNANPVSVAMDQVVAALRKYEAIDLESAPLERFYASVRRRAKDIDNAAGRQTLVRELYETFFQKAFPTTTERLGIVYTPIEIVDFINASVAELVEKHFGKTLDAKDLHIIDAFTGTGTFIVRMLQQGLLGTKKDLARKYAEELHANEIVLLAYYIGAVNIEQAYQAVCGGSYTPFTGMVMTDTFELSERSGPELPGILADNDKRARRQRSLPITVVVSNPPYRFGQKSENDASQNRRYTKLDGRIQATYVARSTATNKHNLYDSYVRAFRWASDRIGERGVIGFVTNAGWLRGSAASGMRACLAEEFDEICVVDLRGAQQRTSGDVSLREGGKVFGQGSRVPIAITLLVRNGSSGDKKARPALIRYVDIGDYKTREQKLLQVAKWGSADSVPFTIVVPDQHHDWLDQRGSLWNTLLPIENTIFRVNSNGLGTGRDAWTVNSNKADLLVHLKKTIDIYERERRVYEHAAAGDPTVSVDEVVTNDPTLISWAANLKDQLRRGKPITLVEEAVRRTLYRPFMPQWVYFHRSLNERVYQLPQIYPESTTENICLLVSGRGANTFSVLATRTLPNLHTLDTCRAFPRYTVTAEGESGQGSFESGIRRDNIVDAAIAVFATQYPNVEVTKDGLFAYIYGVLHHSRYRERFGRTLTKDLPRIPFAEDYEAVVGIGQQLLDLHLDYETCEPYPLKEVWSDTATKDASRYRATAMSYPRTAGTTAKGKAGWDRTRIVINDHLVLDGIPEEAWRYELNDRPVLELVAERYRPSVDKASGITNDPNDLSDDPRYLITLYKRVVHVAIETVQLTGKLEPIGLRGL